MSGVDEIIHSGRGVETTRVPSVRGPGEPKGASAYSGIVLSRKKERHPDVLQRGRTVKTLRCVKEARPKRTSIVSLRLDETAGVDKVREPDGRIAVARNGGTGKGHLFNGDSFCLEG